jgi:uncharacterized protein (TIGR03083 family)
MSTDVFSLIIPEREALAADLAGLTSDQWQTPSLCEGWTVHQALGHIVATAKMTPARFMGGFVRNGFNFNKFVGRQAAAASAGTPAQTLTELTAHAGDTTAPPGPKDAMIGEIVVHSTDIRQPLGKTRDFPIAALTRSANFYLKSNTLIGGKTRTAGIKLAADDGDWSHGDGAEVRGPMLALLMTIAGRRVFLDQLSGPGVSGLRARMAG